MSFDEYKKQQCRMCTNTCHNASENGGQSCCICEGLTKDLMCKDCKDRSTPREPSRS